MKKVITVTWDGKQITMKQLGEIVKISTEAAYSMVKRGHDTQKKIIAYRKKVAANECHGGGYSPDIFTTSKGRLTYKQMEERHPHGISAQTIRYRALKWGHDHKCIWLSKLPPRLFYKAAIKLDGPPRPGGKVAKLPKCPEGNPVRLDKLKFNRGECCYRDKGQERCLVYAQRLRQDIGIPKPCKAAKGNHCPNYDGLPLNNYVDCSGRPPRHYSTNGTFSEAR